MMKTSLPLPAKPGTLFLSVALLVCWPAAVRSQDRPAHLPDPKLTPGETVEVTKDDLCGTAPKVLVKSVPVKVKSQVFALYSIPASAPGGYNVDHLVPVSLGGATTLKNLWPQPLAGDWGYMLKNKLEGRLQKMVCRGEIELKQAQEEIAEDWVKAYKKYILKPKREKVGRHRDSRDRPKSFADPNARL